MLSKLILLLGAAVAALIAYFCIQDHPFIQNKIQTHSAATGQSSHTVAQSAIPPKTTAEQPQPVTENTVDTTPPVPVDIIALQTPSLAYHNAPDKTLSVHAGSADKTDAFLSAINTVCPPQNCKQELVFEDHTNNAMWKSAALKLISFINSHNVKDASITIKEGKMILRGRFPDPQTKEAFDKLLSDFEGTGLETEDQTAIFIDKRIKEPAATEKPEHKTAEITSSPEISPTPAPETTLSDIQKERIQSAQEQINTLLRENPIYFERNSNEITLDSKAILDKIIDIVNQNTEQIEKLRIAGHTDASGPAEYNKRLSRKRAESVREYLIRHNIQVPAIEAIGYGEEQPITDNPYAKENRRVEITIDQGE